MPGSAFCSRDALPRSRRRPAGSHRRLPVDRRTERRRACGPRAFYLSHAPSGRARRKGTHRLLTSSGAFQNLLQSSHHGNCAGLHALRLGLARPVDPQRRLGGPCTYRLPVLLVTTFVALNGRFVSRWLGHVITIAVRRASFRQASSSPDVRCRPSPAPDLRRAVAAGSRVGFPQATMREPRPADLVRSGRSDCTRGHESACCRLGGPLLRLSS